MTLYIHIADERQRPQAERFARLLAETDMGGSAPWVPGIELVKSSPSRSELRCFQVEECRDPGERLTKVVNSLLATPSLALKDLSGRYGSADHVQPRQFELWFAAEEIQLR